MSRLVWCSCLLLAILSGVAKAAFGEPAWPAYESQLSPSGLGNCSNCDGGNGTQCCDNEICCGKHGDSCCPAGGLCCGSGCCTNETQSCCPDPVNGDVCCEAENTFCCPPKAPHPSRCCPRWMVCCLGGQDGCCVPNPLGRLPTSGTAMAMFVTPASVEVLDIDLKDGHRSTSRSGFNNWYEMTRIFAYNSQANTFLLPQANFVNPGFFHNVTLWTVDSQGNTTSVQIEGVQEPGQSDVCGFEYLPALNVLLLSTEVSEVSSNITKEKKVRGYNFYHVALPSGVATLVSAYRNSTNTGNWVGWFDAVSADGSEVYRSGYWDAKDQTIFGLQVTSIRTLNATMQWFDGLTYGPGLSPYVSLNVASDGSFLSLAADEFGKYSLVSWTVPSTPKVVAKLPDAYGAIFFGPVAEYLQGDLYGAMMVHHSLISDLDRWSLILINTTTGDLADDVLDPPVLAKTDSISGIGWQE